MAKAGITFYPNQRKLNQKTGKIPIYLRITVNRTKAEARIPAEVNSRLLELWNSKLMRFDEQDVFVNKILNKYQNDFDFIILKNCNSINSLTADEIRKELLGERKEKEKSVEEYLSSYYQNRIEKNDSLSLGTKKNYKKAINHLNNFFMYKKIHSLPLSKFDAIYARDFYNYLISSIPEINKRGILECSASVNIIKLKTTFSRAIDDGLIVKNPFSVIKLKKHSVKKEKLNSNEIKLLYNLDLTNFISLEKVRGIFLFSIYTGLAYKDVFELNDSKLQKWNNGQYCLTIKRSKTEVETQQFMVSHAMDVVEDIKKFYPYLNKTFPAISNQQMNMRLKLLGEKAGITKKLTCHMARHSFRQLIAEAGIRDLATIKMLMGHSRNNDIDSIYHNVTESQLLEAKNKLQTYLDRILK